MSNLSLKKKNKSRAAVLVAIIIIIIIMVPILFFRFLTRHLVENITDTLSLQHSQELNAQMSANIDNSIDYYFSELNTEFNALRLMTDMDVEKLQKFITRTETDNNISYLAFVDNEGNVYEDTGTYLGTMHISMLGRLLRGSTRIVSGNESVNGNSYIMIGYSTDEPVKLGEHEICAAILGMTNDDLAEAVILESDYSGGYSSIISRNGSFIVKNKKETHGGLNIFSILSKSYGISDEELSELEYAVGAGNEYIITASDTDSDSTVYMYFAPIRDTEWTAVNTLPSSFIGNSITELQDSISKVYVAFLTVFIVVAVAFALQQLTSSRKLRESGEKLEKALQLAEQASNAKTAFLFNMSHDIRTPMNAILGYTDIGLSHAGDTERAQDSFKKIKTSGSHLLSLINDILEMSRIESGKLELVEQELDIIEAADKVFTMSQTLAVPKSIDFKMTIGDIANRYIYADELHINEIIINLISNAVKYTPAGGKVRYSISQPSPAENGTATYRFEIADNGIGMSESFQEHLFETFSREENTTVSKIEGTGLGLSIVKKIVDIAGGTISVKSALNEGSVFTVDLPFRVMDEAAIESFNAEKTELKAAIEGTSIEGKKILLVEDNEINREIATMMLEDAGACVETAEDGDIAVRIIGEKGADYYDCVLMDIQMPVMNGYEATKAIRALPRGDRVKIIALSANAFEEDKRKSLEVGMNAHVAKPIDINELINTMNSLAD